MKTISGEDPSTMVFSPTFLPVTAPQMEPLACHAILVLRGQELAGQPLGAKGTAIFERNIFILENDVNVFESLRFSKL